MTWLQAAPALAAAAALLLIPGIIVTAPVRVGVTARVASSGLISVFCIGAAGAASGILSVPFAAWQPFAVAAACGGAVWVVARRRIGIRPAGDIDRIRAVVLTWMVSGLVIALVAFAAVPSPDRLSQTYDNVFHMSAIASIMDGASASSFTLRTLIETEQAVAFYPAAWHALVAAIAQWTTVPAAVAVNAGWIAAAAVLWVPGAAWVAQVVISSVPARTAVLTAMPLATGFAAMPYGLLTWGTLYPTYLATCILPASVGTAIIAGRTLRATSGMRRWRAMVLSSGAIVATVCALVFAQPRVLASAVFLVAPLAASRAARDLAASWREGGVVRRRMLRSSLTGALALFVAAGAAFFSVAGLLDFWGRPLEERLGGPQAAATQGVAEGVLQVLVLAFPTGVPGIVTVPSVLLAAAVLVGLAVAARTTGMRWVVVSYVAFGVLYALAAGADDIFAKLMTGLWYKDRFRLASVLPVLGVALATLGVWKICRRALRQRSRLDRRATSVAWAIAASSAVVLSIGGVTASVAHVFRLEQRASTGEVVSSSQIAFGEVIRQTVPEAQRVLGDPWDGSAWSGLLGGREPVFSHVNGQWDPARLTLAGDLDAIDSDPAVCSALEELRVRFILYNPHELGGGDPTGNRFAAIHRAVERGLFDEVASDGESRLYAVSACGELR